MGARAGSEKFGEGLMRLCNTPVLHFAPLRQEVPWVRQDGEPPPYPPPCGGTMGGWFRAAPRGHSPTETELRRPLARLFENPSEETPGLDGRAGGSFSAATRAVRLHKRHKAGRTMGMSVRSARGGRDPPLVSPVLLLPLQGQNGQHNEILCERRFLATTSRQRSPGKGGDARYAPPRLDMDLPPAFLKGARVGVPLTRE
jgi:hypothetical protein